MSRRPRVRHYRRFACGSAILPEDALLAFARGRAPAAASPLPQSVSCAASTTLATCIQSYTSAEGLVIHIHKQLAYNACRISTRHEIPYYTYAPRQLPSNALPQRYSYTRMRAHFCATRLMPQNATPMMRRPLFSKDILKNISCLSSISCLTHRQIRMPRALWPCYKYIARRREKGGGRGYERERVLERGCVCVDCCSRHAHAHTGVRGRGAELMVSHLARHRRRDISRALHTHAHHTHTSHTPRTVTSNTHIKHTSTHTSHARTSHSHTHLSHTSHAQIHTPHTFAAAVPPHDRCGAAAVSPPPLPRGSAVAAPLMPPPTPPPPPPPRRAHAARSRAAQHRRRYRAAQPRRR